MALKFSLSNLRTTILHAKKIWFLVARNDNSSTVFFVRLILIYGSVIMESSSQSGSMGSIPSKGRSPLQPLAGPSAILHGSEPISALTHALLYCCSLNGFRQWRSHADRALVLNYEHPTSLF